MTRLTLAIAVASTTLLSGCSDELTDQAMTDATAALITEISSQSRALPYPLVLKKVERKSCRKAHETRYSCQVVWTVTGGMRPEEISQTQTLQYIRGDDGWTASE